MNNDHKYSANPSAPPQYFYPPVAQPQNTINMFDVWRILWKQKKIIYITLLLFTLMGLVLALSKPVVYSFSTTVQIGTVTNDGKNELIESTETALSKIISAYIPYVLAQYYGKNPADRGRYKIDVTVPKKSDILVLEARGGVNQEIVYKELMNNVVAKLIEDHSRALNVKIKNYEASIKHAENTLASSKDHAKWIASSTVRLDKTEILLSAQMKEKKEFLADTLKTRSAARKKSATDAMGMMVIDSEIARYQQSVDNLEKYLFIDLNQQRNAIEISLSDNLLKQDDQQNAIAKLKNELANISNTKSVVPVMASLDPVGLGKSIIVVIFIFLGIVLGIFTALVYEFYQKEMTNRKVSSVI